MSKLLTPLDKEFLDNLLGYNTHDYNLSKAAEEYSELGLILQQRGNKPDNPKTADIKIIEEIGDVEIRHYMLKQLFNQTDIRERVAFKLEKYREYMKSGKYKGRI